MLKIADYPFEEYSEAALREEKSLTPVSIFYLSYSQHRYKNAGWLNMEGCGTLAPRL